MSIIKEQLVKIRLHYKEIEKEGYTKIIVLSDDKVKEMLDDDEQKEKIKVLETFWKVLSWQDQNNIGKNSVIQNEDGTYGDVDQFRYRDLRIKTCLKKWDMKDDDGKEIPCDSVHINMLPAHIVNELVTKYDIEVLLDDEELKK